MEKSLSSRSCPESSSLHTEVCLALNLHNLRTNLIVQEALESDSCPLQLADFGAPALTCAGLAHGQ